MRVTTDRLAGACACGGALLLAVASSMTGCSGGSRDQAVAEGPGATSIDVQPGQDAPGIVVAITSVLGASGPHGTFQAGDHVRVDYTLRKRDGSAWHLSEMDVAHALVSGPSFNYQRVIAEQSDVKSASIAHGNGAYTYSFQVPIPSTYLPALNASGVLGPHDGVLAGLPLEDGTYTVGMSFAWRYTVAGRPFVDAGEATADFRLGDSATFAPREVVRQENCDRCHVSLRAHDGLHRDVKLCLLCHTSGAEDANDPTIEAGTPGVSIDGRVLFHKIHDGAYLPSVVGVGVGPTGGAPIYDATPRPYVVAGSSGDEHDYSHTGSALWPNRTIPMPRDEGYDDLPAEAKARDDQVRRGLTGCGACHGDPDGDGPLVAPAQGDVAFAQPTRRACGACHDDVRWDLPYVTNSITMPPQPDDSHCNECHGFLGGTLGVIENHRHPLLDTVFEPHAPFEQPFTTGLEFGIQDLVESGANDGDGTIDPGEKVQVTFTVHDDTGALVQASTLSSIHAVISGPTWNSNLVLDADIPPARFAGAPPYTTTLPERVQLELVGRSTAATGDVFTTSLAPHWHIAGAPTVVSVRTGTSGVASSLATSSTAGQNFLDLADAGGFARDDTIVIDDGNGVIEEYSRIQFVDGHRLWFSSPSAPAYPSGLRFAHGVGASVSVIALQTEQEGSDYALDATTGRITELIEFGAGNAVLVDFTTDFVMPGVYPLAANSSPDLDETSGKWAGKRIVQGTYRLGIWGAFDTDFFAPGQQTTYTIVSHAAVRDFLVKGARTIEPYALISSADNCNACHQDLWFHEGKQRGFDACILCHSQAGSEDQPQYVAAHAPATTGVTVNFRTLLHAIKRGSELAHADTFAAVDASSQPYPDNFSVETFQHIVFPAMPGGTQQCAKCHGETNTAWLQPAARDHPTEQGAPVRVWSAVCASCHDSDADALHIAAEITSQGVEQCADCHAPGLPLAVDVVHKAH